MSKKFALSGAAGYVAPRHLKAIKDVGGELVVCTDPHDSVGVLDRYFRDCQYFPEWQKFDEGCRNNIIDYFAICVPNHLHPHQAIWGMMQGMDIICEKPLAIKEHLLDDLKKAEVETGKKVNVISQLRLMPNLQKFKDSLNEKYHDVQLAYVTPRGPWYYNSWKNNKELSGGLLFNIGIHMIDLLLWFFGECHDFRIQKSINMAMGKLFMEKATVAFKLSIIGGSFIRKLTVDGETVDFNSNFNDLHTKSYREIIAGRGFGIEDVRPAIALCEKLSK